MPTSLSGTPPLQPASPTSKPDALKIDDDTQNQSTSPKSDVFGLPPAKHRKVEGTPPWLSNAYQATQHTHSKTPASIFSSVPLAEKDPLIGLTELFNADTNPNKVYLGVGSYKDSKGEIPVMDCVRQIQEQQAVQSKPYLSIEGLADFTEAVKKLIFGKDRALLARTATVQSVGGTGAIRVGAGFLKSYFSGSKVWTSDPSWPAHESVFESVKFEVNRYPYYDKDAHAVNFDGMLEDLEKMEPNSIVILQACCHNPTGADLNKDQWRQVIDVVKKNNLVPFIDMAYQGFSKGIAEDAKVVRDFVEADVASLFVATSNSKNFGQYGERVGALSVVCANPEEAENIHSQLKVIIRTLYSNPPTTGAQTVATALNNPDLRQSWEGELKTYRERIMEMRTLFVEKLEKASGQDFKFVLGEHGMFSYLPLSVDQVVRLRKKHSIYLVETGRMCVASLNAQNIDAVTDAIARVLLEDATDKRDAAPVVETIQ